MRKQQLLYVIDEALDYARKMNLLCHFMLALYPILFSPIMPKIMPA